jgi:hypothetical protein
MDSSWLKDIGNKIKRNLGLMGSTNTEKSKTHPKRVEGVKQNLY